MICPIVASTIPRNWTKFTAIIASVGVGNVSQLACDLLVFNLNCKLAANIDFQFLPAVVGSDPYETPNTVGASSLMTCCQLYLNEEKCIAVIQFRAPPFPQCAKKHVTEVFNFIRSTGFSRVVILSSSFAMQRKDTELMESQLRYAMSDSFNKTDRSLLEGKKWPTLIPFKQELQSGLVEGTCNTTYHLPGSGIASRLFDACCQSNDVQACLLNCFASEGDNAGDALYVVHKLNEWLTLLPPDRAALPPHSAWRAPSSWCLLYGNDGEECLY